MPTGSMVVPRSGKAATLLFNGKVLGSSATLWPDHEENGHADKAELFLAL